MIRNEKGARIARVGEYVGDGTINVAEYHGILYALRHAIRLGFSEAVCKTDSQLLAFQANGQYRIKDERIQRLNRELRMLGRLIQVEIIWTRRDGNQEADELTHESRFEVAEQPNPLPSLGWRRRVPDWQAAAIRRWMEIDPEFEPVLTRVFNSDTTFIRQIVKGASYKNATDDGRPQWDSYVEPSISSSDGPSPAEPSDPAVAGLGDFAVGPDDLRVRV